ncbi:MAG: glycosyltransferase family 2 protein [Phycisphaerales bacterium]
MNRTDVTIVIVSWNTREILRDCLRSVYENAGPADFDIIVVDNASTDGSVEMVRAEFAQVQLIANSDNRGFASANNQGIAVATGRYVLLLNSDTIVLDGAIAKTVAFADTHPDAAVVGCRVLNPDRTLQASCFLFPSILNMLLSATYLYRLFPRSRFFGRERMTWWDKRDARAVDVISGCFMLVRREAIEQVGPMDEGYFMYAEETDWCYRFQRAGWSNMYTPDGQIIHLGGQSTARVSAPMTVQLRLSILRFIRKHRGPLVYWVCCLLVSIFFLVRVPVWLCVWLFVARNRQLARAKVAAYLRGAGCVFLPGTLATRGK